MRGDDIENRTIVVGTRQAVKIHELFRGTF
jgi:hypothetical protein